MKTKIFIALLALIGFASCDKLSDINVNPNNADNSYDYDFNRSKLSTMLRTGSYYNGADLWQRVKSLHIDLYSQMLDESVSGWVNTRNYLRNDGWTNGYWNSVPQWISTLNIIIKEGLTDPERANSVAVARIWRVYIQSQACDVFGVMPFPSYSTFVENPPYKSVKDQYTEFFSELDAAAKQFDNTKGFLNSYEDMIFKGDVTKWKKFANSLRLRLALRVSEVDANLCATQAKAALAGGVMESATDDAKCPPSNIGWGQDYNYTLLYAWGETQHMTTTFEKLVSGIGGIAWPAAINASVHPANVDPRAPIMFDPSTGSQSWKGVPPGLHPDNVNQAPNKAVDIALLGVKLVGPASARNISRPYDLFMYDEVCFLKAEAALRGFVTGVDAKTEYENGVRASFTRWGVAGVDSYLASTDKNVAGTSASFNDEAGAGNTKLEKIITQKYIANFPDVSIEGWSDKRRLNLPRFDVCAYRDPSEFAAAPSSITNPASYVKRIRIPLIEQTNNTTEYNKGVLIMQQEGAGGGDKATTRIWWDQNKNYCTSAQ